jgi:predicted kinase
MQAIIFTGIQASGKSTFYKENFFDSHIRINLDLIRTRNRERKLLEYCLSSRLPFVVDNTNPTKKEREVYINLAREYKYRIIGYYFQSQVKECLERNSRRTGKQRIPDVGALSAYSRLEIPSFDEGYDELKYVKIKDGKFRVTDWHEVPDKDSIRNTL